MANDRNDSETGTGFDPLNESLVEHIKLGVWDVYIMRTRLSKYLPTSWKIEEYARIWEDVPYLWKTLCDMSTVAGPLLLLYLVITLAKSLIPALSLWCVRLVFLLGSGRCLQLSKVFWAGPWNSEHLFSFEPPSLKASLWLAGAIRH